MEKECIRCGLKFLRPKRISNSQWLERMFCSKKCSGIRIDIDHSYICDMYKSGDTAKEISRKIGISGTHVLRILKSNGVEIRSNGESISIGLSKPDVKDNLSKIRTGRKLSEESKDKLRERIGPKNHNWNGGITKTTQGYIAYTASTYNMEKSGKLMHRVVVEESLGVSFPSDIYVHHKDKVKTNNNIENLEPMTPSDHMKLHIKSGDLKKRNKNC